MSQAICCPQCQALLPLDAAPDTPCADCLTKLGLETWRAKRLVAAQSPAATYLAPPSSSPQTAIMYAAGITLLGAFACAMLAGLGAIAARNAGLPVLFLGGGLFLLGLMLAIVLFIVALTIGKGGVDIEPNEDIEKFALSLTTDETETIRQRLLWPSFGLRMAGLLSLLPLMTIAVFIFIIIVIQFTNQTH